MSGGTSAVQVGSVADMCRRMRAVLPSSWFPIPDDQVGSSTPVLDAVLAGMGHAWAAIFAILQYARAQTRLTTMNGSFLDIVSADFFGNQVPRQPSDTDDTFRTKLLSNLLVDKATRAAVIATLLRASGTAPAVQEPRQGPGLAGYGYGGYNVDGFAFGSAMMPFQMLVSCFRNGIYTTRQSSATYVGANGKLAVASMYSLRSDYSNEQAGAVLSEDRGFNLIKDSLGWTSASIPWISGSATVIGVDNSAPLVGAMTVDLSIEQEGEYQGPAVRVAVADSAITGSIWIKVTGAGQFSSLYLRIADETQVVSVRPIPTSSSAGWQRCSVTHTRTGSSPGYVVMDIIAATTDGGCGLATQCWQIEAGQQMTSYIPSRGAIGIRAADKAILVTHVPIVPVDRFTRDNILVRTLPAGVVAWIRDIS